MATIDHSPEAAQAALHGLYGWAGHRDAPWSGELIEVSIKSPRGKWHAQHWPLATLLDPETLKGLAYWSSEGREVYMGCVGLRSRPPQQWRRGGAALRGHAGALWLDVDCQAPGREGTEFFTAVDEAVEIVDLALGPVLREAALVIGSGWGVQYWIPLYEPVPAIEASRVVRALVGWVGEVSARQIDRVWDVTRVMRMPGTLNWRAGPGDDDARPTGVVRWPEDHRRGLGRLGLANVIDALGSQVSDVLEVPRLDPELDAGALIEALLERYAPTGADGDGADESGSWAPVGLVLGDLDRLAHQELDWADVLVPAGWRCVSGQDLDGREHEQVWERPGKDEERLGERSAVVYADKPELLVVYSDSPQCGFATGLRGSGRRGSAAGVGVISKWRAWVDLKWAGDEDRARRCVRAHDGGEDDVAERLAVAWEQEMGDVERWGRERELEALESPFMTSVEGHPDP